MGYIEDYIKKEAMIKEFSEAVSYVKSNIDYPFDKISGYLEYADTKEHSGYVYVEKYTLHRDTYYAVRGRPGVSTIQGKKLWRVQIKMIILILLG